MKYFSQFPQTTTTDYNGNSITVTNILERVEIIPEILNTALAFYAYNIQDGDTPDIIAKKYYGDDYRYWMVPYVNQMTDVQSGWPMSPNLFNDYIIDKYAADAATYYSVPTVTSAQVLAYVQLTIKYYIKKIVTLDEVSSTQVTNTYLIDAADYNALVPSTTIGYLPDTNSVTQTISKYIQYVYDYEIEQNEAKRNINLINASYASTMEKELTALLGQ